MEPGNGCVPDGFVRIEKFNDLLAKYERLQQEYSNFQIEAKARSIRAANKIHDAKERIRAWQQYLDKKSAKKAMHHADPNIAPSRTLAEDEVPVSLAYPAVEAVRNASASASNSPMTSKITSSQTTQGEEALPSSPAADSDGDMPVVVSARSLKRKKNVPPGPQPPRVKQEQVSSSPLQSAHIYPSLLRTETSDLDILNEQLRIRQSQIIRTDTLQRHLTDSTRSASNLNQQVSSEHTIDHDSVLLQTPSGVRQRASMASSEEASASHSQAGTPGSNITVKTAKTDPGANTQPYINPAPGYPSTRMSKSFGQPETASFRFSGGPLHDLSPNTPTLPRTSAPNASNSKKNDRSRGAAAVHVLSEDGENITRSSKKPRTMENQDTSRNRGMGRLEHLLDGSSPQIDKTVLSPRSAPAIKRHRESVGVSSRSAEKPVSRLERPIANTIENGKPGPSTSNYKLPQNRFQDRISADPGPVLPEDEPFRCLPLHRLNIDSFKVNPHFSERLGYAYRETLRKRSQRDCLPGCTREECCGAIRKFVEAGGLPNAPRRGLLFPVVGVHTLSDDELTLQGYLGAAYTSVIHSASKEERQKMLVEARAKAFADKHGKHRQVFERRTTPPGFWRTDMPTTQEMEEDREEARKMERQKVEERWRDAMRGDGRWMFRDE